MKTNHFLSLAAMLCTSLLLSCTTNIEPSPPPLPPSSSSDLPPSSSSAANPSGYCIYPEMRQCFPTSQATCPADGESSDFCPYGSSTGTASSSSLGEIIGGSSSSSTQDGQSSSDAVLEYGYCVFATDGICLAVPISICPPGGTLSNSCPYGSSSSNAPSSSSNTPPSSYKMVAFIYDTDMSVHPDFSCSEYTEGGIDAGNGANAKANCTLGGSYSSVDAYTIGGNQKGSCLGVRKGLVQSTLDPATKKIKYNAAGDKWNCWTSEDWFNKAFSPTPGVNVQRCYYMPLIQQANGRYEFDSDKMTNANGRLVGGFFPYLLTTRIDDDGTRADYSQCPNCDAKRPAQNFAPLINPISADMFDQYSAYNGDFYDGDHPDAGAFGGDAKKSIWNWGDPKDGEPTRNGMSWYLHGTTAIKGTEMAPANQFFCFESHAEFIYDPKQEFIFRGDDDIWVYINNKLVVDLGGTHLAAPGHVILKDMTPKLVAGEKYPIDIFFCDRRTTMSNVRISTNIFLMQTTETCESTL